MVGEYLKEKNDLGIHSEIFSSTMADLIESGKIDYVVATSVKGRHPELGSVHIRRTAVERAIPCLTSMDTVSALLRCLEGDIKIENCEMVDINTI